VALLPISFIAESLGLVAIPGVLLPALLALTGVYVVVNEALATSPTETGSPGRPPTSTFGEGMGVERRDAASRSVSDETGSDDLAVRRLAEVRTT